MCSACARNSHSDDDDPRPAVNLNSKEQSLCSKFVGPANLSKKVTASHPPSPSPGRVRARTHASSSTDGALSTRIFPSQPELVQDPTDACPHQRASRVSVPIWSIST